MDVEALSLSDQVVALVHSGRPFSVRGQRTGSTHRESDVVDRLIADGYAIVKVRPNEGES